MPSIFSNLQFIIEFEGDKLDFLDVTNIRSNKKLEFNWFHKPIFSGRYNSKLLLSASFRSEARHSHRALLLSHPRYHEKNLCQVMETVLNNNYPLKFIFEIVYKRLKYHSAKNKKIIIDNGKNKDSVLHWLPYISRIWDKIKTTITDLDTRISYFSLNKLGNIIKHK